MPDILTRGNRSDYDECAYFHEAAQMYCGGLRKDHGTRYTGHQFTPEPPLGRLQIPEVAPDHGRRTSEGSQRNLTQSGAAPETVTVSLPALRAIILTLIDDGWQCAKSCDMNHSWKFYTEEFSGAEPPTSSDIVMRERFCDEIERRLRQLPARG